MIKHFLEEHSTSATNATIAHPFDDVCAPYKFREFGFSCTLAPIVQAVCNYVRRNIQPCESPEHIPWGSMQVCAESQFFQSAVVLASLLFFFYLFILLTTIADSFFFANLKAIKDRFNMSEDLTGITLVAYGNSLPDVISSFTTVLFYPHPEMRIAVSELLGNGIFVTSVCLAAIIFIQPVKVLKWPALYNIGFYLVTLSALATLELSGRTLRLWHPLLFLALYGLYLAVNGAALWSKGRSVGGVKEGDAARSSSFAFFPNVEEFKLTQKMAKKREKSALSVRFQPDSARSRRWQAVAKELRCLLRALSPINTDKFCQEQWAGRMYRLLKAPSLLVLKLTNPLATTTWCKSLAIVHVFTAPLFLHAALQLYQKDVGYWLPAAIWLFTLISMLVALMSVLFLTSTDKEPKYYKEVASIMGFVLAVVWIYAASAEVVDVVMIIGHLIAVPYEMLTITAVTWSNSVGDIVANISIARKGFPQMAFSATIGGPLFNLLVGFGTTFLLSKLQGKSVTVDVDDVEKTMFAALAISLLSTLLFLLARDFRTSYPHAVYLCILYIVFLVMALLAVRMII